MTTEGTFCGCKAGPCPIPGCSWDAPRERRPLGLSGNLHIQSGGLAAEAHGLRDVIRATSESVRSGPVSQRRAVEAQANGLSRGAADRMHSMGLWAWLMIIEKEADKLSVDGQNALALLREDLEALASGQEARGA